MAYQKQITSELNLSLSARTALNDLNDNTMLLTLRFYPGEPQRKYYDMASYQIGKAADNTLPQELTLQKFNTRGLGLGYNMALNNEGGDFYGSMRGQYNDEKGIATGNYILSQSGDSNMGFSWAESVALLDGEIYTGRPIDDSFAVVKIPGRKDVPVELYNNISGYTNDEGELLVPEMTSYMVNNITIPDNILTLNESIDTTAQSVNVKQRGGSKVSFNIQKFTAIEGQIEMLAENSKRVSLSSVPLEIVVNNKKYESFVGRNGYFYVENLPVGSHVLSVLLYKGNCKAAITVPESEKIVQNLGNLTCRR